MHFTSDCFILYLLVYYSLCNYKQKKQEPPLPKFGFLAQTPNFYNNLISNLQFHKLHCSYGHSGYLTVHGYYHRYLKTPSGKLTFSICRVKCEVCGKTHAILLSSFVPYSQILLKNHIEIIEAFEDVAQTASLLKSNDSIDEISFRYIIRQYLNHWKQKLLSEKIALAPFIFFIYHIA